MYFNGYYPQRSPAVLAPILGSYNIYYVNQEPKADLGGLNQPLVGSTLVIWDYFLYRVSFTALTIWLWDKPYFSYNCDPVPVSAN